MSDQKTNNAKEWRQPLPPVEKDCVHIAERRDKVHRLRCPLCDSSLGAKATLGRIIKESRNVVWDCPVCGWEVSWLNAESLVREGE